MCNDHKLLQKFLSVKNIINKVNHWSLELATYDITFKWMSSAHNKAADCLSRLVEVPESNTQVKSIVINVITASPTEDLPPTPGQGQGFARSTTNRCFQGKCSTTSHKRSQGHLTTNAKDRPFLQMYL